MIKVSIFLARRDDLTHEEFIAYWTEKHSALIGSLPAGSLPVRRYVQLRVDTTPVPEVTTADFDGVAELWVDEIADAVGWFTSPLYLEKIAPDEENFLDRSRTTFLFAEEQHVFG